MGQKLGDPIDGMSSNASQDIFEPGEGIDENALAASYEAAQHGCRLPPMSLPKNSQLPRPTTTPRIVRSVPLLSISRFPSWE
jgi:hypothetical protein